MTNAIQIRANKAETGRRWPVLGRLLRRHLWPERLRIFAAIFCMLIVAGTTAVTAYLLDPVIKHIFIERDQAQLLFLPLLIIAVSAVKAVGAYGQGILMADASRRLVEDIQSTLFGRLMAADFAHHADQHSGQHHTNFLSNAGALAIAFSQTVVGLFRDIPTAIGLIFVMFLMDWQLALVALLVAPLIAAMTQRLSKSARKGSKDAITASNRLAKQLSEALKGIRIVKAFSNEAYETRRAESIIRERMGHYFRAQKASLAGAPITEALAGIGIAGVIYYGGSRVLAGTLEFSAFFTFLATMLMAFQPIRTLSALVPSFQTGLAAAEAIFSELDVEPKIIDQAGAAPLALRASNGAHIRFEGACFDYGDGLGALKSVSLEARPGETIALVGPSGAGKSTIFNMLMRLYDLDGGRITIDGQEIRELTIASLRANIALVSQDAILFDDSIGANIAYGRPGAGESEIIAAARLAAADEFIRNFPSGYDTIIGEDGGKISGGQKQRLAIARAFLKNAPILLLDEATSALDSSSEQRVQEALRELMKGRTTFVIAHRLSTVRSADRIYVMDRGRIIEAGRHDELIARKGLYARLHETQLRADHEEERSLAIEQTGPAPLGERIQRAVEA